MEVVHDIKHALTKQTRLPLRRSMELFYKSLTYKEIDEGISDMHCRSGEYLTEEMRRKMHA